MLQKQLKLSLRSLRNLEKEKLALRQLSKYWSLHVNISAPQTEFHLTLISPAWNVKDVGSHLNNQSFSLGGEKS